MTRMKLSRWLAAALVTAAALYLNVTHLAEAFGSGPPYYDRTTNMDKWDNPIPALIAIDLVACAILASLVAPRLLRRLLFRRGPSKSHPT